MPDGLQPPSATPSATHSASLPSLAPALPYPIYSSARPLSTHPSDIAPFSSYSGLANPSSAPISELDPSRLFHGPDLPLPADALSTHCIIPQPAPLSAPPTLTRSIAPQPSALLTHTCSSAPLSAPPTLTRSIAPQPSALLTHTCSSASLPEGRSACNSTLSQPISCQSGATHSHLSRAFTGLLVSGYSSTVSLPSPGLILGYSSRPISSRDLQNPSLHRAAPSPPLSRSLSLDTHTCIIQSLPSQSNPLPRSLSLDTPSPTVRTVRFAPLPPSHKHCSTASASLARSPLRKRLPTRCPPTQLRSDDGLNSRNA